MSARLRGDPESSEVHASAPPADDEATRQRRTLERSKELDHEHRRRHRSPWRSGAALALSLRFLRGAARGWLTPMRAPDPVSVPHPRAGALAVSMVGHATVMVTSPEARLLTDPLLGDILFGLRRAEAATVASADMDDLSLVLLSHAHHDHLHLPSLRRLPRTATVVVPPRCAPLVEPLGFHEVITLEPGESFRHRDLRLTAVAARHDGARGFGDFSFRGVNGYVIQGPGVSVYFAGDTGYFSGFEEIGRRLRPDVALLPIGGYEPEPLRDTHMSPLDALHAFEDLGAQVMIPIAHGAFPLGYEPLDEPRSWLASLAATRGLTDRIAALRAGETCLVRARTAPVDDPAAVR